MDFSNPDCDLVKKKHPRMCLSALLTMPVFIRTCTWLVIRVACKFGSASKSSVESCGYRNPSAQHPGDVSPAWGTLWRLVADLEDILNWLKGGNK